MDKEYIKQTGDRAVVIILDKLIELLEEKEFKDLSEFESFLRGLKDKFNISEVRNG